MLDSEEEIAILYEMAAELRSVLERCGQGSMPGPPDFVPCPSWLELVFLIFFFAYLLGTLEVTLLE